MIDTVAFTTKECTNPDCFAGKIDHRISEICFTGRLENLRVTQTLDGLTVSGSIAKYLRGDNFTGVAKNDVADFIQKFSECTGLDAAGAVVKRVDYAETVVTRERAAAYMQLFGECGRYKRAKTYGGAGLESVLYYTKRGGYAFAVYDKLLETRERGGVIPCLFEMGENALRLEYRILKRAAVKRTLGGGNDLTLSQLAGKEARAALMSGFAEFYEKIQKTGRTVFVDLGKPVTPKIINDLMAESFRQHYPDEAAALVESLAGRGRLDKLAKSRARAMARKNAVDYSISMDNDLVHELNEALRRRGLYGAA